MKINSENAKTNAPMFHMRGYNESGNMDRRLKYEVGDEDRSLRRGKSV